MYVKTYEMSFLVPSKILNKMRSSSILFCLNDVLNNLNLFMDRIDGFLAAFYTKAIMIFVPIQSKKKKKIPNTVKASSPFAL